MLKLDIVKEEERIILEKLLQLYLHDISLYFPMDFNSNTGEYEYDSLEKYFNESTNYPYFIRDDGKIAGFILVDIDNSEKVIQEMFVMNNFKGKGIGKEAVFFIFNEYKGNWTIKSLPNSPKAENFWNKTIKEYTNNLYNIEHVGRYNRAVFTFSNIEDYE